MRALFSSSKIKQLIIFIRLIDVLMQLILKPEIFAELFIQRTGISHIQNLNPCVSFRI